MAQKNWDDTDIQDSDTVSTVQYMDMTSHIKVNDTKVTYPTSASDKLATIEESADVTDATNVAAAGAVMNTGDESISGVKTFNSNPIIPAPTTDLQAATKKYVDDNAGGTPEGTAVLSTGETGAVKFLREDGDGTCSWQVPAGAGDMTKVIYDPTTVNGDAFDMDNMVEGATTKILTATERTAISTNSSKISYTDATKVGYLTVTQPVDLDTMESNVTTNNAKVSYPGSANATELNILDGATLSTTELNYVDGVTSSIQTQLNAKGTLSNVSEDTTPQLGGELDCQAHSVGFTQQSATGDGTTTINWGNGNKFKFTFGTQNETFTFTAPSKPGNFILVMVQDATGSRTATFPATVKWAGGSAPTLTTTASGIDIVSFYYDGTNYYGVGSLNFS